jgi:hypothetical protein
MEKNYKINERYRIHNEKWKPKPNRQNLNVRTT